MKNITESIKKLHPDRAKDLSLIINLNKARDKDIIESTLTSSGIHSILSSLSRDQLTILNIIYRGNDGISFRNIEKATGLRIEDIDTISNNLMNKLLVYRIKNRQLLTNKMDKLYGIQEIASILNLSSDVEISDYLGTVRDILASEPEGKYKPEVALNNRELSLLKKIASRSFLLSFDDAREISGSSFNKVLTSLQEKKVIKIFHHINRSFNTYLTIEGDFVHKAASMLEPLKEEDESIAVNNRHFFLLNILNVFDIITTFGLFLTKQGKFRKIDKKRITETMFRLKNASGVHVSQSDICNLTMNIMHRLNCLRMDKDIAIASLKNLSDEIKNPGRFTLKIINSLKGNFPVESDFPAPFQVPSYNDVRTILYNIHLLKETTITRLSAVSLLDICSGYAKTDLDKTLSRFSLLENRIHYTLNFLCMLGVLEISGSTLKISKTGLKSAASILGFKYQKKRQEYQKSIYINPDFTLIIPADELDSSALYFLLAYTDIVKNDFILHTVLSKNSIVKAQKRGLDINKFVEILNIYSKNDIPQNLTFLLTEWTNQTIMLNINRTVLLKVSHPSFIEDILNSKIKNCIIERISPNHALIEITSIDEIVKLARKSDAVISLFEE